ncbi:MAG: sulfotransferase [Gammaproteobacteria bacterium]|nr:sulfotransferase [Gammaproteobacteria bacterium]
MAQLLEHQAVPLEQRAHLHYALAQVFRRSGDDARFLKHLFAANDTQKASAPKGGRARYQENFARLQKAFTAQALARAEVADAVQPSPIFVVGMPRSGTTLVEQIIAAHPDVASGGELDFVRGCIRQAMEAQTRQKFPLGFDRLSKAAMTALAEGYARRAR